MSTVFKHQGLLVITILVIMFSELESRKTNTTQGVLQQELQYFCYGPSSCANVTYSKVTYLQHAIASPHYYMLVRNVTAFTPVDNTCNTIFKGINDNSFVLARSVVYKNGEHYVEIFIVTDTPNNPGSFSSAGIIGGDVILLARKGYILNITCPGSDVITSLYLCNVYLPYDVKNEFVAVSSNSNPSDQCLFEAQTHLESVSRLKFTRVPNNKPFKCVTRLNGVSCFNANSVDPKYSLEL